jgi:hypothetical protein
MAPPSLPQRKMPHFRLFAIALATAAMLAGAAPAETLGDPQIGFTAERVLVFDGHEYKGRMWNMPGEQRHEQSLPAAKTVFLLRADSAVGDIVLPALHTAVEFALPREIAVLSKPALLGRPVGQETINGIATTKYAIDKTIPQGRLAGTLWLGRAGIPMRCDGSLTRPNGKVSRVHWELRDVAFGRQDAALFEVPAAYGKIPPEAAAALLGMRLAHSKR